MTIQENRDFNDSTRIILNRALIRYSQLAPVSFQMSSYGEMKNTGLLNLIYNIDLRQRLNEFSSSASIISSIIGQISETVNGSNQLFNQYLRIYVGEGNNRTIAYDEDAIADDPVVINTLSRFTLEWDGYAYFLGMFIEQMSDFREDLQQELKIIQIGDS